MPSARGTPPGSPESPPTSASGSDTGRPGAGPALRVRTGAAVEAHRHVAVQLSDFATAVIRDSGQIPEEIRTRHSAEEAKYGMLWRGLVQDADADGGIRSDLDLRTAQCLVMGALNRTAEWWNPERDSFGTTVRTTRSTVLRGLNSRSRPTDPRTD
ncbi:hypothetical protein [Streptomyces hirsutus]|uniref:hypothetical protein n=1 Tax=Streptomyces hirsutus TaxID=35620 RepID=UPI0006E38D35|nr:hypothetical protein [Streptomyces hirsutus]